MEAIQTLGLPAWCAPKTSLTTAHVLYEVPLTTVEALERRINTFLRRWLSVPKSLSSIGLYSSGSKLKLPVTSIFEEFKVAKAWQVLMLCDSSDQLVY